MHRLYEEFIKILESENRESSLRFVLDKLEKKEIDIVTLYTMILSPALNTMVKCENSKAFVWKEHIRSSIIRTIIENCYLYVIKERDEVYKETTNKKIAVVCPTEELHEIGARMVTDFFTLLGYHSIFVGSNTPKDEFIEALKLEDYDYIAISVSSNYNLVAARKTIERIREASSRVNILVGGNAFRSSNTSYKDVGADGQLHTFEDIIRFTKEDIR